MRSTIQPLLVLALVTCASPGYACTSDSHDRCDGVTSQVTLKKPTRSKIVPRTQTAHVSHHDTTGLVARARAYLGQTAASIGLKRRTLWCNEFVNYITGGGTGSNLARSWLSRPRLNGPQVGAVVVLARGGGGHSGIVSGVTPEGNITVISGNHGNIVAESVYPRNRVLAFVMP